MDGKLNRRMTNNMTQKSLASDKVPGLDGFSISFFHKFWDLLRIDIMVFMKELHSRGRLSKSIGASFIALIPKKTGADSIRDFRPLSLLGDIYKILAKLLARFMKGAPRREAHLLGFKQLEARRIQRSARPCARSASFFTVSHLVG